MSRRITETRHCYACGSDKTVIHSTNGSPVWMTNKPTLFYLCKSCFDKIIYENRKIEDCISCRVTRARSWNHAYGPQGTHAALCHNCYSRYLMNPIQHAKHNPRRFKYKGKDIWDVRTPRIGVCNLCRAVVGIDCIKTHLHHEQYDDSNPKAHTIEVCLSCHSRRTKELGQLDSYTAKRQENLLDCPFCKSHTGRKMGLMQYSDGSAKQRYHCRTCKKQFYISVIIAKV